MHDLYFLERSMIYINEFTFSIVVLLMLVYYVCSFFAQHHYEGINA